MEIKDTSILIKVGVEYAHLEGEEVRKGEFLTTKISGEVGKALTVEHIHGAAGEGVAQNIGRKAWGGNAQADSLNTQWVFGSEKLREEFLKDKEIADRRRYMNRRGPKAGRGR